MKKYNYYQKSNIAQFNRRKECQNITPVNNASFLVNK